MKTHTIDVKELLDFKNEAKILFASSTKGNKFLYCTALGGYEVWIGDNKVHEGVQAFSAVEKYNSII